MMMPCLPICIRPPGCQSGSVAQWTVTKTHLEVVPRFALFVVHQQGHAAVQVFHLFRLHRRESVVFQCTAPHEEGLLQCALVAAIGANAANKPCERILLQLAQRNWRQVADAPTQVVVFVPCAVFLPRHEQWAAAARINYRSPARAAAQGPTYCFTLVSKASFGGDSPLKCASNASKHRATCSGVAAAPSVLPVEVSSTFPPAEAIEALRCVDPTAFHTRPLAQPFSG